VELRVTTVGRPFRLASPKPSLIKIMPITGLHHKLGVASRSAALERAVELHLL
jgi:hypothetical protein